jgi:hypothetical protein
MAYSERRWSFFGYPIIYRHRKIKSRGLCLEISVPNTCFNALHAGKISLYWKRLSPMRKVGKGWSEYQPVVTKEQNHV